MKLAPLYSEHTELSIHANNSIFIKKSRVVPFLRSGHLCTYIGREMGGRGGLEPPSFIKCKLLSEGLKSTLLGSYFPGGHAPRSPKMADGSYPWGLSPLTLQDFLRPCYRVFALILCPQLSWAKFLPHKYLTHVNDCTELLVIFTARVKICSVKYFCNARWVKYLSGENL